MELDATDASYNNSWIIWKWKSCFFVCDSLHHFLRFCFFIAVALQYI